MTLNQLGYFYQAAVLQHFNQAAEKMNISEPSLSRSIAALEDELGVTLFEKRGRNVILTKAGEIFLEHATQILDDVKRAENKMHHLATDGGHIDIAYVSPLAREYIPRLSLIHILFVAKKYDCYRSNKHAEYYYSVCVHICKVRK